MNRSSNSGFSLVELSICLGFVGILALMGSTELIRCAKLYKSTIGRNQFHLLGRSVLKNLLSDEVCDSSSLMTAKLSLSIDGFPKKIASFDKYEFGPRGSKKALKAEVYESGYVIKDMYVNQLTPAFGGVVRTAIIAFEIVGKLQHGETGQKKNRIVLSVSSDNLGNITNCSQPNMGSRQNCYELGGNWGGGHCNL